MVKNFLFLAFIIFILQSCQHKNEFIIKGTLSNASGKTLYLDEVTSSEVLPSDSVVIAENGSFEFRGQTNSPSFYLLRFNMNNFITLIVDSLSEIEISGDALNLPVTYSVKGSEESEQIMQLDKKLMSSYAKIDSLGKIYQQYKNMPGSDSIQNILLAENQKIYESNRDFNVNFIKEHPGSLASLKAIYQKLGNVGLLNLKEDFGLISRVDSTLGLKYAKSNHYKALHANCSEVKKIIDTENLNQQMAGIGADAPEISLPDPNGKIINLSDYKGKYVLLDFWASWCKPCRMENPNLVANYKKYRKKGFEIFQVSLDKTKGDWLNGIKNDKLEWVHVSDLQYWDSPAARLYNVSSIPANFLIDKDGKIIASNLRGEALGNKLAEIFK